jgi:formylglycine-generating enzyme required for sulfatase activity
MRFPSTETSGAFAGERPRSPRLWLPFAVLGVAVGDAASRLLTSPIVEIADLEPVVAVVLSGIAAALVGVWLTHLARAEERADGGEGDALRGWTWRVFVVVPVGGVVGAAVSWLSPHGDFGSGVGLGLACAVAACPLCVAIVHAAIRARRARLGSIVAAVDLQQVYGSLGAAIALAALPSAISWPLVRAEGARPPWLACAAVVVGGMLAASELSLGRAALRRLGGLVADLAEPTRAVAASDVPSFDLGLGEGVAARVEGGFSYRGAERETALVIGDVDEAKAAIARAVRWSFVRVAAVVVVALVHVAMSRQVVALAFETKLCARGRMASCDGLGDLLDARGVPGAVEVSGRACVFGVTTSCARLAAHVDVAAPDHAEAKARLDEACNAHVGVACQLLACAAPRTRHAERNAARRLAERAVDERATQVCATPREDPGVAPDDACPAGMARVDGGTFPSIVRGGPAEIAALCVDVTEVTRGAYRDCPKAVCGRPDTGEHCTESRSELDLPVNCVTHAQAEAYCAFRHARLPTAEEWEWVARGGDEAATYPWGSALPKHQLCWSGVEHRADPCPVGAFPEGASRVGILDLVGNVAEWTSTKRADDSPRDHKFVFVGGSWRSTLPDSIHFVTGGGDTSWGTPGSLAVYASPDVGFRCVDPW